MVDSDVTVEAVTSVIDVTAVPRTEGGPETEGTATTAPQVYYTGLIMFRQLYEMLPVNTNYRERKCADTTGTVPVPWAGHFQR